LTAGILPAPGRLDEARAATDGAVLSDLLVMKGYRLTSGYVGLFPASFYPLNGRSWRAFSGTRWLFTPDGFRYPADAGAARVRLLDTSSRETGAPARLVVDRPGHLVAELQPSGPGILAITERFHDGWSATTEGRSLPTVRVNSDFLGCAIDAGVHRVELRFDPPSYAYGRIVSAAGVALLAAALFLVGRGAAAKAPAPRAI